MLSSVHFRVIKLDNTSQLTTGSTTDDLINDNLCCSQLEIPEKMKQNF